MARRAGRSTRSKLIVGWLRASLTQPHRKTLEPLSQCEMSFWSRSDSRDAMLRCSSRAPLEKNDVVTSTPPVAVSRSMTPRSSRTSPGPTARPLAKRLHSTTYKSVPRPVCRAAYRSTPRSPDCEVSVTWNPSLAKSSATRCSKSRQCISASFSGWSANHCITASLTDPNARLRRRYGSSVRAKGSPSGPSKPGKAMIPGAANTARASLSTPDACGPKKSANADGELASERTRGRSCSSRSRRTACRRPFQATLRAYSSRSITRTSTVSLSSSKCCTARDGSDTHTILRSATSKIRSGLLSASPSPIAGSPDSHRSVVALEVTLDHGRGPRAQSLR